MRNTIEAAQRELTQDGLLLRYRPDKSDGDRITGRRKRVPPCSFWLVDCLHLRGRNDETRVLFQRPFDLRNNLGLLSEEYDPVAKRLLGGSARCAAQTRKSMIRLRPKPVLT